MRPSERVESSGRFGGLQGVRRARRVVVVEGEAAAEGPGDARENQVDLAFPFVDVIHLLELS